MLLVDIGALEREVDEPGNDVAVPDRNLAEEQRRAWRRLQQFDCIANALVGLVDLVKEEKARNVLVFQFAQNELKLGHFLLVRLAHDDGGIDRRQHAAHILDELDGTGAVDERVVVTHEGGGGECRLDAHLVVAGFFACVTYRGTRVDRALALDRAGSGKDRFK